MNLYGASKLISTHSTLPDGGEADGGAVTADDPDKGSGRRRHGRRGKGGGLGWHTGTNGAERRTDWADKRDDWADGAG